MREVNLVRTAINHWATFTHSLLAPLLENRFALLILSEFSVQVPVVNQAQGTHFADGFLSN